MQMWSAHTRDATAKRTSVYATADAHIRGCSTCLSTFDSLPSPRPFLHWSDGPSAGYSLLLWRLDVSSVDSVQLHFCDTFSFVPCTSPAGPSLLLCPPLFIWCTVPAGPHVAALTRCVTCGLEWCIGTVTRRQRRDERTAFSRRRKTRWNRWHWREDAHVAIDDVRAFLAESWYWKESSWGPRTNCWRWWRTRASMLGKASHGEFVIFLRTLSIEDRKSFAVVVTSMLDAALEDAIAVSAVQSDDMLESVGCLHFRKQRGRDKKMMYSDSPVDKQEDDAQSDSSVNISVVEADAYSAEKENGVDVSLRRRR